MSGAQGAGGASPVWGAEREAAVWGGVEREAAVWGGVLWLGRCFAGLGAKLGWRLGRHFAGFWGGVLGLGRLFLTGDGGGEKFFLQKRFKNY